MMCIRLDRRGRWSVDDDDDGRSLDWASGGVGSTDLLGGRVVEAGWSAATSILLDGAYDVHQFFSLAAETRRRQGAAAAEVREVQQLAELPGGRVVEAGRRRLLRFGRTVRLKSFDF